MSAFADGLKKAGVDTAAAELYTACVDALKGGRTPQAALKAFNRTMMTRRHLLDRLGLEKLEQVYADMTGHKTPEPQREGAGHGGAGQVSADTHAPAAGPASPSVDVKAYKVPPHKRRTPEQKAAANAVAALGAEAIFSSRRVDDRDIGDLLWGELISLAHATAAEAASYLRMGTLTAETAVLLGLIEQHCVVDDHTRRVRDVISAKQLAELDAKARMLAPKLIDKSVHQTKRTIEDWKNGEHG